MPTTGRDARWSSSPPSAAVAVPARRLRQHRDVADDTHTQIFNAAPWAIFSTGSTGTQLLARVSVSGPLLDAPVACGSSNCLGEAHRYRIDWTATAVDFSIDGTPVVPLRRRDRGQYAAGRQRRELHRQHFALRRLAPHDALRDAVCSSSPGPSTAGTRAPTGPHSPRPRCCRTVRASFSKRAPATTCRSPDRGPGSDGRTIASPKGRYLQYRVTLSTTDANQTPELDDATVCFTPCTPGTEVCNGVDDNCDGNIDENFPDLGAAVHGGPRRVPGRGHDDLLGRPLDHGLQRHAGEFEPRDLQRSGQRLRRHGGQRQSGRRPGMQHRQSRHLRCRHDPVHQRSHRVQSQNPPTRRPATASTTTATARSTRTTRAAAARATPA